MTIASAGRALRAAAVICTFGFGCACATQAPAQSAASTRAAPQLFAQACAKCHSADGTGGLPMAANGPRPVNFHDAGWQASRSDDEIVAAIRDGRGAMPPFNDVLNPEELATLARYVRTLRPQATK